MQDDGLTAAQGGDGVTGFTAATVGNVDVTLTGSNGAVPVLNAAASTADDNQPSGDNLDSSGQATAVFTSANLDPPEPEHGSKIGHDASPRQPSLMRQFARG